MAGFDRIRPPQERLARRAPVEDQDEEGRAALFSASRPSQAAGGALSGLSVECSRCGAVSPLDAGTALRSVLPLALVAPWKRHPVFAVCPAGRHRAWLRVLASQ